MDGTVRLWNVWNKEQKLARIFSNHGAAVKDIRWSPRGFSLLSCGYDCSSKLLDVEKGIEIQQFTEDQVVETIRFHPRNPDLFLSCGSNGSLKLWDIRTRNVVKEYFRNLGPILDIEFRSDARHFISSSDISRSNVSENAIIVWDFERQIPLSNQVRKPVFMLLFHFYISKTKHAFFPHRFTQKRIHVHALDTIHTMQPS